MPRKPALIFLGTGAFGVPALERLAQEGLEIRAVYTQPPRPAGRGYAVRHTPVHDAALKLGIANIRTPTSLRGAAEQSAFGALGAELAVVAAYGLILPRGLLDLPPFGCINIHGSKLPRWRGAAPIQRAIEAGDTVTGVSFFQMDEGIDTGPLLAVFEHPIRPKIRAPQLHDELAALAARHVVEVILDWVAGRIQPVPQPAEGATYAPKIRKDEGHLDFRAPAALLERRIRAFDPWPGCWCFFGAERLLVLEAEVVPEPSLAAAPGTVIGRPLIVACGEGALSLLRLQRPGRRPLSAEELQRGFPIPLGARLR